MKTRDVLIFFLLLLSLTAPAVASGSSPLMFQFGLFDEQGFFSNYAGLSAEADLHLGNLKFGLNQKIYHGFTYGELCGQTNVLLYVHDSISINLGASYLISESPDISSTDFGNGPLPVVGFGFNIATKNPRIIITPFLQMNQCYYSEFSIRATVNFPPEIIPSLFWVLSGFAFLYGFSVWLESSCIMLNL
ncbi:MAG: hypothetical protein LWX00_07385 [Spirochaetia bacterium]|nr:hypothetical protein [Spirochaetia bacterium]